jgi:hypothetical protein
MDHRAYPLSAPSHDWAATLAERTVDGVDSTNDRTETDDSTDGARTEVASGKLGGKAWRDIFLYGLARLVLFLVLTVVIQLIAVALGMGQSFPLLMSALLALIIAFPLSMFLFKKLRLRVNQEIAVWDAGRQRHKEQMRRQLEDRLD